MYLNESDIINLRKIVNKLSINNLLYILINHDVDVEDIKLNPIFDAKTTVDATILNIYVAANKVHIDINVFKVRPFSKLENIYKRYETLNLKNALLAVEKGVKELLYRYVFGSNTYMKLTKQNIYIRAFESSLTIHNVISGLYRILAEDYLTIISHDKQIAAIPCEPSFVGDAQINEIHLGNFLRSYVHCITIKVIFLSLSSEKKNIEVVKNKVQKFVKEINNVNVKINIISSNIAQTSKEALSYIGDYHLDSHL
ncbi:hypothetical protein LO80_06315 [Candidatus Francisella endociliophora]|uniref:Uncharacterized protein n=1 Tax=Candidatus Francisella endociliophora TaxID=653937 RepID=A0A097EPW9_9GAMM|nr:type VI secretion system baseplate protein IglJ [Francisella sp. FSC1006]AIT09613.1 hypothetical protein LO80_06315 [Francisella sp. FSC1006]